MEMPAEATQCPVRGCGGEKPHNKVICENCWARVPEELKIDLHKAWAKKRKSLNREYTHSITRQIWEAHDRAKEAVIASAQRGGG